MTQALLLLGRPGCHLCEELLAALQADPLIRNYPLTQACVDDRADWRASYGARIPVLLNEQGRILAEGRVTLDELRSVLNP